MSNREDCYQKHGREKILPGSGSRPGGKYGKWYDIGATQADRVLKGGVSMITLPTGEKSQAAYRDGFNTVIRRSKAQH